MSNGSASGARGIEHIGLTVPDIDAATEFLVDAFGAEFLYDLVTEQPGGDLPPLPSDELQRLIGVLEGTTLRRVRVVRLSGGPNLELFEFDSSEQRVPARPNDFGLQHFAVLVDDIETAGERVRAAGGEALAGPNPLPGLEAGEGNLFWYTRSPWGSLIELVQIRSAQAYESTTPLRRWRPVPLDEI